MSISRRDLLKGMGLGALSIGLLQASNRISYAQSPTGQAVAGYFRFALGDYEMIVASDNAFALPFTAFGANAAEEDVRAQLESLHVPISNEGTANAAVSILILTDGDRVTLFDTGTGVGAGKLVATLDALGIGASGVTQIVMSHWHPDHIDGLSTDGVLTFPNAQVFFAQPEYDFMQSAPDVTAGAIAKLQPAIDAGIVTFYNAGDEVVSGVEAIATPGHTPGHMAFSITSGGSQLINVADSVASPYTAMPNPDWAFGFDADVPTAVESRKAILGRIDSERALMFGYHFTFPGLGYAVRQGESESYQFVPAAF